MGDTTARHPRISPADCEEAQSSSPIGAEMLLQLTSMILPCSFPQPPSPAWWETQVQFLQQHPSILSKLQQPGEGGRYGLV